MLTTEQIPIKRSLEENEDNSSNKKLNMDERNDEQLDSSNAIALQEPQKLFNGVEISKLTKRQMKKYKKCLKWNDIKKEKRLKERQKLKEKRLHAKINNIDLGPSRKELKRSKMKDSPCKISVCIDLSFDSLMIDKVGTLLTTLYL